jgi:hypothetical protein
MYGALCLLKMTCHVHYLPGRALRTKEYKYIRDYSDIAKGMNQYNHMETVLWRNAVEVLNL